VTFSGNPQRAAELRRSARKFLRGAAESTVVVHEFRDGYFPANFAAIKDAFETLKTLPVPDLVFTHHLHDRHQDHRVVSELTWNTFRDHCILEYEIPKFDGGLATPNVHIELSPAQVERKIRILLSTYQSQLPKRWFTADTFRSILRLRGIESGAQSGWAEGFHGSKLLLG
jgi:LmbE family N-acetylglucosaminyl deacetylase